MKTEKEVRLMLQQQYELLATQSKNPAAYRGRCVSRIMALVLEDVLEDGKMEEGE